MKIVIAPDSYKGCLSSKDVSTCMAEAVASVIPSAEIVVLPVADGGEGTVEALCDALGGERVQASVADPLGRKTVATYCKAGDLAVIESAAACGLTLLEPEERNPLVTSSKGLGELILDAIGRGCKRFMIGLGGSATNDGGRGMVEAEGFLDKARGLDFVVACDVDTPFAGPDGASRVFGPQKGASSEEVGILEERLCRYAGEILQKTGKDIRAIPGTGAAGGLGGAFYAFLDATMKRGVDIVLDTLHFDGMIRGADLVITGEGRSDSQTLTGKTPFGILQHAHGQGIPVALLSGAVADRDGLVSAGFSHIQAVTPTDLPLAEALLPDVARVNIRRAVLDLMESIQTLQAAGSSR